MRDEIYGQIPLVSSYSKVKILVGYLLPIPPGKIWASGFTSYAAVLLLAEKQDVCEKTERLGIKLLLQKKPVSLSDI